MKVKITNFDLDHDYIKELCRDFSQKIVGKTIDVDADGSEDEDELYSIILSETTNDMIEDCGEWIWCGVDKLNYKVV